MKKLLCLSLACYTFAAPIAHDLEARQIPGHGPAGQAIWQQPPSGFLRAGPRQWGILYPQSRGHDSQQNSLPNSPTSDQAFSGEQCESNSPLLTTSGVPAAELPISTAFPLEPRFPQEPSPVGTFVESSPMTFAASAYPADNSGSSPTIQQPTSSTTNPDETLPTSLSQPSISADTVPPTTTPEQSTEVLTSSSMLPSTNNSQPVAAANATEAFPSTISILPTSFATSPTSSSPAVSVEPPARANTTGAPSPGKPTSFATSLTSSSLPVPSEPPFPANTTLVSVPARLMQSATSSVSTTTLSTSLFSPPTPTSVPSNPSPGALQLSLVNNLASNSANAYISAIESSSGRVVMLTTAGTFFYLPETGSGVPQPLEVDVSIPLPPQGQSLQIAIPGFVEGARVWFADGTLDFAVVSSINGPALVEPTAVRREDGSAYTNWGFVELAYVPELGLFANLSFVDFVGLPLGLQLQTASSGTQTVPGMPRDAVQQVCDRLRRFRGAAARDWADLCVFDANGDPIRVISPAVLLSQRPDTFPAFFRRYVDRVWAYYSTNTLTIDTQNANGKVGCRVVGDEMQCDGDNRGYAKPNAEDIFGCDRGPFSIQEGDGAVHRAVVPRLCAAFNRGTLLLDGGGVQPALPPASYYTARPHNLYSALVHAVELEGRGYAFSYDDVAPSPEENVAGTVAAADPQLLTVFVGGI